jgi:5-oxoprolinase (ATP-hydrolysing)
MQIYFSYYETVAGGTGAGPTWHGRSGVHVHMTNTRLTDPEILERRYPVILDHFSLAPDTGGRGRFIGGDGVRREIRFRKNLLLSILTERRVLRPFGLHGGGDGQKGVNHLKRQKDGKVLYLGGKCSIPVESGDVFIMQTPGGGGWGEAAKEGEGENGDAKRRSDEEDGKPSKKAKHFVEKGSLYDYQQMQNSA